MIEILISYLQSYDISYLFAGKETIDCTLLLRKLKSAFGIERLMIAGGGATNWSFLPDPEIAVRDDCNDRLHLQAVIVQ